jgi:hypothetical protein
MRRLRRSVVGVTQLVAGIVVACGERAREPAPAETAAAAPLPQPHLPPPARPPARPPAWDTTLGPVLAVRGASPAEAVLVFPHVTDSTLAETTQIETAMLRGRTVDLFNRSGRVGQARLDVVGASGAAGGDGVDGQCPSWPRATASRSDGGGGRGGGTLALPGWSVAFLAGRVEPITLDSIEGLPAADSAKLAAEVTRLASALPHDTARAFRGIPFAVRTAYRFSPEPGVDAVAAEVVRTVPQEATPLREHILLIGERASGAPGRRYRTVYSERASGLEERVETTEIVAAVRLKGAPPRPALVLARAGEVRTAYALLVRSPSGRWRVRWTSARTGC